MARQSRRSSVGPMVPLDAVLEALRVNGPSSAGYHIAERIAREFSPARRCAHEGNWDQTENGTFICEECGLKI